jgi:DNA-binding LacI/PurR family transcriptional regulator
LSELRRYHVPHVLAHRRAARTQHSVILDDEAAAGLAVDYLAQHGHTQLGIVIGPLRIDTARRRLAGFRRKCQELGLPPPNVESREFTARGGFDGVSSILMASPRPTAIFVSNLLAGTGALAALHAHAVGVPEEMSLIAYDDDDLANYTLPKLTTIAVPYDELGRLAVDAIDGVLHGREPGNTVVTTPARVVERESVVAARVPATSSR